MIIQTDLIEGDTVATFFRIVLSLVFMLIKNFRILQVNYRGKTWESTFGHQGHDAEISPWVFTDDSSKSMTFAKQISM